MERKLNLVVNQDGKIEERVFPRFPFNYLTFKRNDEESRAFAVQDISYTGMQLALRDGEHQLEVGSKVEGELHWKGHSLTVSGDVVWTKGQRLGFHFDSSKNLTEKLEDFFSVQRLVDGLREVQEDCLDAPLPQNLKYWFKADGALELFIWSHAEGSLSKIQIIMMRQLIEWIDGEGIKTGNVISLDEISTPLKKMEQYQFRIDNDIDKDKVETAREVLKYLSEKQLPKEIIDFIQLKIRE